MTKVYDAVIIGGGFFGLSIANYLRINIGLKDVLILEKEDDFMQHASYNNQARVHGGYHYPRSFLTGLRSQVNFPNFIKDYEDAIVKDFDKYYAVARNLSKVSATQFKLFCERIGAEIRPANDDIKKLFNRSLIEDVFSVKEYAFNAHILKDRLIERAIRNGVVLKTGEPVHSVTKTDDIITVEDYANRSYKARAVFNCTYSMINDININSGLSKISLKHELAEMPLVELPVDLEGISVTVMCGPFFSFMPFPDRKLYTLSHVRYTPHSEWHDEGDYRDGYKYLVDPKNRVSNFAQMYRDAIRYIPTLKGTIHKDSLWEVKTVLSQSEVDDSRPILFRENQELKGYYCVLGGKLDNIYDVLRELDLVYG